MRIYGSLSVTAVLVLVAVVGAQTEVRADGYVHRDSKSGVIATWHNSLHDHLAIVYNNGRMWEINLTNGSWKDYGFPFPIMGAELDSLEWMGSYYMISRNRDFWYFNGSTWIKTILPSSGSAVPGVSDLAPTAIVNQNYPNPFNPSTTIIIRVEKPVSDARIQIFDVQGQKVRTIPVGDLQPIEISITWDGRNGKGEELPSGVYFYQLAHKGGESNTQKAVLLK